MELWDVLAPVISSVSIALITFVLTRAKYKADIEKLNKETITEATVHLEKLQEFQKTARQADRRVSEKAKKLTSALQKPLKPEIIRARREDLCQEIDEFVFDTQQLLEWYETLKPANELGDYVERVVIPDLHRLARWVAIVNMLHFRRNNQTRPLQISQQTLWPTINIVNKLPKHIKCRCESPLESAINAIQDAGDWRYKKSK